MKRKNSIPVIYTMLVTIGISIAFMGCAKSDSNTQKKKIEETFEEADMPVETLMGFFEERISVTEILNDSVIYKVVNRDTTSPQPMGPSTGGTSYYRQYFDSGDTVKLGTIQPFIIGMGETAIVDNVLYFCVTSTDENGQENNNLYGIDLGKNQLDVYYTDNEVIPIMEIFAYQDKLLFWKTKKREGDSANTYFEIYDPKDGNTKKVNNHSVNHSAKTGSVIMTCFVNGDTVYAWVDEYDKDGNRISTIRAYDEKFRCIQTINLGEVADYIKESRVDEIAVFGDYIYLHNLSGYNVVGKIENGTIKPVLKKRDLVQRGANQRGNDIQNIQLFFVRKTNTYYILDLANNTFTEKTLKPFEDYRIREAEVNANAVLIIQEGTPGEHISDKPYRYIFCDVNALM